MNLLLVTGIFPPDIGGPATYMPRLAESLTEAGESVQLITLSDEPVSDKTAYRVERIIRKQRPGARSKQLVERIRAHAETADLIFANGLFGPVMKANKKLKKPQINKIVGDYAWELASRKKITSMDMVSFNQQNNLLFKFLRRSRNYPATRADALISPSQFLQDIVLDWGYQTPRIEVIANGVEIPQAASIPSLPENFLISIGRLIPLKRLELAIQLMSELPAEYHLVLVGNGPQEKQLRLLTQKLKLEQRVHLLGALPFEQTFSVLKKAAVMLQLSQTETFSHTVIEAMAAGVPVAAANTGGMTQIITHNQDGILLSEVSVNGIRNALLPLFEDQEFAERLTRNALTTSKRYTWGNCFQQTYQLIHEVANRS